MKKGFIIGTVVGLTIAGASLVFANSQIQAILNNQIKVTLNGITQEFRDETTNEIQYPITYHDRTYLPLRTVANLVGVGVDYDANTNSAILTDNKGLTFGEDEASIKKQLISAKNWYPTRIYTSKEGEVSLINYYGSGVRYSNAGFIFKDDGTFTCFIGIWGESDADYTGKYSIDTNNRELTLNYNSGRKSVAKYSISEINIVLDFEEQKEDEYYGNVSILFTPKEKENDYLINNFKSKITNKTWIIKSTDDNKQYDGKTLIFNSDGTFKNEKGDGGYGYYTGEYVLNETNGIQLNYNGDPFCNEFLSADFDENNKIIKLKAIGGNTVHCYGFEYIEK